MSRSTTLKSVARKAVEKVCDKLIKKGDLLLDANSEHAVVVHVNVSVDGVDHLLSYDGTVKTGKSLSVTRNNKPKAEDLVAYLLMCFKKADARAVFRHAMEEGVAIDALDAAEAKEMARQLVANNTESVTTLQQPRATVALVSHQDAVTYREEMQSA